ncbi:MAG: DUF2460 domain-containing protein [Bacillota bacterium]
MLIETDFSASPLGNLDSDPDWEVAAGSATNLSIVSYGSGKAIASAGGTNRYVRENDPATVHQRVEISFTFNSTSATVYTGVVARHVDANNYILAQVLHRRSSLAASLVERIAGVEKVLGTVQWSGALPEAPVGGAIRLELVGRRARLWYEQNPRPVTDRPPDLAVDLSSEGSQPGQWGIYISGTTDAKITRFVAADIPAMVMPPPSTVYSDATSLGCRFTPITVEVAEVPPDAVEIEWEVYPADADDFPEAYRDLTDASITSRTLWVRPGFSYDLRCRERRADGTLGDWTDFERINLVGNKAGVPLPVVPTIQFPPIVPDYVMPRHQETKVGVTVSDTGRERLQSTWPTPRNSFDLVFENRSDEEAQTLIDFFEQMQGQKTAFAWTHPTTGRQYALRFAEDNYTIRYDDQGDEGSIAYMGFSVIEVYLGMMSAVLVNLSAGEASSVDPDALVDALNDRAMMANEPAYQMTRTLPDGNPLSAAEFNSVSANTAYLAQNVYVGDYNDPDSFGDYQKVTVATDAEVTDRRLVDLRTAIQKMKYVRRPAELFPHHFAQIVVTHPTYSEDNTDGAYDLIETYWGQNTTMEDSGYSVTAIAGVDARPYNGCFYLVRAGESGGALTVDAYIYNAQVSFDFSSYQGTSARVFVKAAVCTAPGAEGSQIIPGRAFHDILDSGIDQWTKLQDVPGPALGTTWVGDVPPTLGDFDTGPDVFNDDGLAVTTAERVDKPVSGGDSLAITNEIRGQFSADEAVGFALEWSDDTHLAFGDVTYSNVGVRELTPTALTAAAGFTVRDQDVYTSISLVSAEITDTGQLAVLVEKTSASRIRLAAVSSDGIFRVIGSARSDGVPSSIQELVFDGCTGKIEVMGTPGSVRYCYLNKHVGGYEEVVATVDGQDGAKPGVTFIRGLPLDLVTTSDSPEALPLVYPEAGETMSIGWLLKEAVVLIEVPSGVEIGSVQTW